MRSTTTRIPGRYLTIRAKDGTYYLDYLDRFGDFLQIDIIRHLNPASIAADKRDILRYISLLKAETNPTKKKKLRLIVDVHHLCTRLPEIYKTHCEGGNVSAFFQQSSRGRTVDGKKRKRKVELYTAKHEIVKRRKKQPGKSQIDICRKYLASHEIIDKPDYTPEQLSNIVSQLRVVRP